MSAMPTYVLLLVIATVLMPGFYWLCSEISRLLRSGRLAFRLLRLKRRIRKAGGLESCPPSSIRQAIQLIDQRMDHTLPHRPPRWIERYRLHREQMEIQMLERQFRS